MADDKTPALPERIYGALNDLVKLQITTSVGNATWNKAEKDFVPAADAKVCYSTLNMLTGDIKTHLDPSFVKGENEALREFHLAREKEGAGIIKANIEALMELVRLARELAPKPPAK